MLYMRYVIYIQCIKNKPYGWVIFEFAGYEKIISKIKNVVALIGFTNIFNMYQIWQT